MMAPPAPASTPIPILGKKSSSSSSSSKKKMDRVSRFVSDLRSSSKQRSRESLVVQTGFPTSLIDVIVKHRDRLKKSSSATKIKTTKSNNHHNYHHPPIVLPPPPPPPPPMPHDDDDDDDDDDDSTNCIENKSEDDNNKIHPIEQVEEEIVQEDVDDSVSAADAVSVAVAVSVPNRFIMLFMNAFVLLTLALGTKKVTVGITVFTFILVFLEFAVGKRLLCCTDARNKLQSVIASVLEKLNYLIGERTSATATTIMTTKSEDGDGNLIKEMQIVKSDLDLVSHVERVCSGLDEIMMDQKKRYMSMSSSDENTDLLECPNLTSLRSKRSEKFKAKLLKTFRHKKFCKIKTENGECQQDESEVKDNWDVEEEEDKSIKRETPEDEQEEEEPQVDECECDSSNNSETTLDIVVVEGVGRTIKWSSLHLITFLIVLIGLIGGRILALVLTVTWCLLMSQYRVRRETER